MKWIFSVLVLVLLAGCSYQSTFEPQNDSELSGRIVIISDFRFNPQTIVVAPGEQITWKNLDTDAHTVLINGTESDELEKGEIFTYTAPESGRFNYLSGNHPFMKGTIVVQIH
jgi:plastocyanin